MDTQIELILEKISYSGELLRSDLIHIDIDKDCLFSFDESDVIYGIFQFDYPEIRIEIESSADGSYTEVISGDRVLLSDGREDITSFYPGYFGINIIKDSIKLERLFLVKPKRFELDAVLQLRNYVNSYYYGLSYNLRRKRVSNDLIPSKQIENAQRNNSIYILKNMPKLITLANQFINIRHSETIKVDEVSSSSKKMGNRSIRWLAQKGMTVNKNVNAPDQMLVRKTRYNLNNQTNQIFKNQLAFWNNELASVIKNQRKAIASFEQTIAQKRMELSELETHWENIEGETRISRGVKQNIRGQISDVNDAISTLEQYRGDYTQQLNELKHFKTFFENCIYNTWLKEVSFSRYVKRTVSENHINLMDAIKNEYLGIKRRSYVGNSNKTVYFAEKSTPKLFETYIFLMLIEILTDQGFEFENVDIENDDIVYLISNPGTISFCNGEIRAEIIYDTPLKRSNDALDRSQYVTVNSRHNRPDFILSFTDMNGKLIDTKIIDAKWRPLNGIYNALDDTDVVETLKEYFNLGYHNHQRLKTNRGVVSQVLVIYPDNNEIITNIQHDEILAVGTIPTEQVENTNAYQMMSNFVTETLLDL